MKLMLIRPKIILYSAIYILSVQVFLLKEPILLIMLLWFLTIKDEKLLSIIYMIISLYLLGFNMLVKFLLFLLIYIFTVEVNSFFKSILSKDNMLTISLLVYIFITKISTKADFISYDAIKIIVIAAIINLCHKILRNIKKVYDYLFCLALNQYFR